MGRKAGKRRSGDHQPGGPRPDDWSLVCDPHMGVITTRFILQEGLPVLRVVCDEDGDWQFVDNVHDSHLDDALLVCLHHVLEHDPSL